MTSVDPTGMKEPTRGAGSWAVRVYDRLLADGPFWVNVFHKATVKQSKRLLFASRAQACESAAYWRRWNMGHSDPDRKVIIVRVGTKKAVTRG